MAMVICRMIRPAPSTLLPSEQERRDTALHEIKHAAFACSQGFKILDVDIMRQRTLCVFPFNDADALAVLWQTDWQRAQQNMRGVIGTLVAPYVGSYQPIDSGDASHIERWREAWEALPVVLGHAPVPWSVLVNSARRRVELWLGKPGVSYALELLAFVLRQRGRVDVSAWQELMGWKDLQPLWKAHD